MPTLTGFASPPTPTFDYWICGDIAVIYVPSSANALSNTTRMTITNLPSALQPASESPACISGGINFSINTFLVWYFTASSATVLFAATSSNSNVGSTFSQTSFTSSGSNKGFGGGETCIYPLF
jgi:hypothetical protein